MTDSNSPRPRQSDSTNSPPCSNGRGKSYANPFATCFSRRSWHDDRYEHFVTRSLEDFPDGYPRLAAKVNSDIDTQTFRSFGWLRCRALLQLQDQLQELETDLNELDKRHELEDRDRLISRRFDDEVPEEGVLCSRPMLMKDIKAKLKEYDGMLARQRMVSTMPRPHQQEFRSYFDWVFNAPPIIEKEFEFIYHKDDMITLGRPSESWVRSGGAIKIMNQVLPKLWSERLLTSRATRSKSVDPYTDYYSNERLETLVKIVVNLTATSLLILPTALLYILNTSRGGRLAILIVFTCIFNVALVSLTTAKRHEVFTATAAYCAVLVVFLGSISGPKPSGS